MRNRAENDAVRSHQFIAGGILRRCIELLFTSDCLSISVRLATLDIRFRKKTTSKKPREILDGYKFIVCSVK